MNPNGTFKRGGLILAVAVAVGATAAYVESRTETKIDRALTPIQKNQEEMKADIKELLRR